MAPLSWDLLKALCLQGVTAAGTIVFFGCVRLLSTIAVAISKGHCVIAEDQYCSIQSNLQPTDHTILTLGIILLLENAPNGDLHKENC